MVKPQVPRSDQYLYLLPVGENTTCVGQAGLFSGKVVNVMGLGKPMEHVACCHLTSRTNTSASIDESAIDARYGPSC